MSPSPIGKVLSTIRKHRVRALLMGGQACILYGAAEFTRDVDLVVLADERNLDRLRQALVELRAEPVYFPMLSRDVLERGHACHFRTGLAAAAGLRIDVMSVMHGCDGFDQLWARRRQIKLPEVGHVNVLALADLVRAKKTQRDKDWPMIRRLVEADYHRRPRRPRPAQIDLWLREARTADLLIELCRRYPKRALRASQERSCLRWALKGDVNQTESALRTEEEGVRQSDRAYWQPLREELFRWRQSRRK